MGGILPGPRNAKNIENRPSRISINVIEATTEIKKAAIHPTLNTVLMTHIQTKNDMNKATIGLKKTLAISIVIPIRNGPTSEMIKA